MLIFSREIMHPCKNEDIVETRSSTNRTLQKSPKSRIFQKLIFKSHNSALFHRYMGKLICVWFVYIPFSLFVCTIFCTRTQNVFCVLCTFRFHPVMCITALPNVCFTVNFHIYGRDETNSQSVSRSKKTRAERRAKRV